MVGMWLNTTFGGVGVGFVNMFLYIVIGVFISGMMVGRTPEYLGKKVETREMKFALLGVLAHPLFILGGTALFAATSWGTGDRPEQRLPRLFGNPVRVHLLVGQQRFRL